MAERSNATSKKNQDAAQDVTTLQKRGRRRLVGAIALVLLAVIILPMVFDPEPKPTTPPVSIRIPSEESTAFTPKVAPKPGASQPDARKQDKSPPPPYAKVETAAPPPEPAKPAEKAAPVEEDKPVTKAPEPKPVQKAPEARPVAKAPEARPVQKSAPPPAPKPVEKKAAPVPASTSGERLIVQVGAFGSPDKVREVTDKLKEARLAYFTESIATAKGQVTRVRLGPFSSKDAAEKARDRARSLGLNPANPVAAAPAAAK